MTACTAASAATTAACKTTTCGPPPYLSWGLMVIGVLLLIAIAAVPVFAFARRGWKIKRDDIAGSLNGAAIRLYYAAFLNGASSPSEQNARQRFERLYVERYGRLRLMLPLLLLLAVLVAIGTLLMTTALHSLLPMDGGWHLPGLPAGAFILGREAFFAEAGAYSFVVAGLVQGAYRYNLPPLVLVTAALRLLIAVPLGYAVAGLASNPHNVYVGFIAFAAGAVPIETLATLLRRAATSGWPSLAAVAPPAEKVDRITDLYGVDRLTAETLRDAGISTTLQLSYCDPVQLSLRTNVAFDVVLDLQSVALAYNYFGTSLDKLRPIGLRGAVEIANLFTRLSGNDAEAAEVLTAATAVVGSGGNESAMRNALDEIANDPYTRFLVETWRFRAAAIAGDADLPFAPEPQQPRPLQ